MADSSSISAIIKNGEVTNATSSTSKSAETAKTGYDKDSFMQILVAQMKYQDPLQPTSNTEYISQYAQFSQVEQLSNMADAMSLQRASEMVGKTVVISQDTGNGTTTEVQGVVDFINYSENTAYLNIGGVNYSIDDVTQVISSDYTEAMEVAEDFKKAIDNLPNMEMITEDGYGETIDTMYTFYTETMSDKAKGLMDNAYVTSLQQYVNRIDEIRGEGTTRSVTETTT